MWSRRRQVRGIAAAPLLVTLLVSHPGLGQSTLSGERGTPLVPVADTVPAGEFQLSAAASLMGAAPGDRFHAAPFGLTIGLWNRLEAGVAFQAMGRGLPQARGVEQDLRLSAKALLLTEYVVRPALSLSLAADHPFQGWDFLPSAIAQKHLGSLLLTGQFGWRLPRQRRDADPPGPFYGAAATLALSPSTTLMLQAAGDAGRGFANLTIMPGLAFSLLGPDLLEARRKILRARALEVARSVLGAIDGPGGPLPAMAVADPPPAWTGMGLIGSARTVTLQHPGRITFFVTGGPAFGDRATWSVFAGIQIASFDELLQDSDGDGIPDRFDQCPYEAEDWDGYEDEDGCPDNGLEILKKRAEEARSKAEAKGVRYTTPFPRYRLSIPIRPMTTVPRGADPIPSLPPPAPPAPKPIEHPRAKPEGVRRHKAAELAVLVLSPAQPALEPEPTPPSAPPAEAPVAAPPPGAQAAVPADPPRLVVDPELSGWSARLSEEILDVLRLPIDGAATDLPPPMRRALAGFSARTALAGKDLEVWGRTSRDGGLDPLAEWQAGEIADLAARLGGLPPGRAHVAGPVWWQAPRADFQVLQVARRGGSP